MGKKVVYKVNQKDTTAFFVAAINTAEDDYRLAWLLNGCLKINLVRAEHTTHNLNQSFPIFHHLDEVGRLNYTLIANKVDNSYLSPQLKNIDYLLKISGTLTDGLEQRVVSKIRSICEITACILIKTGTPTLINLLRNL